MFRRKMWLTGTAVVLLLGLAGALIAQAQSDEPPFTVARVLTEEEAAAGATVEAYYFDTFEEAMEFVGVTPQDYQSAGSRSGSDKHCVVQIEPLQPGQTESETSEPVCFGTFSEALSFATGGAIRFPSLRSQARSQRRCWHRPRVIPSSA
jgi:hypothetical protein